MAVRVPGNPTGIDTQKPSQVDQPVEDFPARIRAAKSTTAAGAASAELGERSWRRRWGRCA
jgi:hypothetical protein